MGILKLVRNIHLPINLSVIFTPKNQVIPGIRFLNFVYYRVMEEFMFWIFLPLKYINIPTNI